MMSECSHRESAREYQVGSTTGGVPAFRCTDCGAYPVGEALSVYAGRVVAVEDGTVTVERGKVRIRYIQLEGIRVEAGQDVRAGDVLGFIRGGE